MFTRFRTSCARRAEAWELPPKTSLVLELLFMEGLDQKEKAAAIIDGVTGLVAVRDRDRRVMMRDPGGDAIDAVLAALGAAQAFASADHVAIARHARYPREGHLYV